MKRFVAITAAAMYACLDAIGEKVKAAGGHFEIMTHGKEVVYELYHHAGHDAVVRIYTSIAQGTSQVRACDSDAVRVVIGCYPKGQPFKPLGKSRKILRTAPNGSDEEREKAFLARLTQAIRDSYADVAKVPTCPKCGSPMALRKPKKGGKQFSPFYGCVDFPNCKATQAA